MAKDIAEGSGVDPLTGKPDWALSRRERRRAERARLGLPPRPRTWPWVLLVLLVTAAGGVWQNRDWLQARFAPPPAPEEPVAEAPPPVRLTQINRGEWTVLEPMTLRRSVKVIGTLRPARRSDLSAETSGQVEAVLARPGDAVGQGDLLVQVDVEGLTLDRDVARSNAEVTRTELALAEQQLERARALSERGVAAASTLDEAESSVQRLRASLAAQEEQVAQAERALEGAAVRAPFDGVIASRSVEAGNVVAAGTALLSIVDLTRMEMLASAPVSAGAVLRPAQNVELHVDGIAGHAFQGVVDRVAPVAEEGTRTLTVYVLIENEERTLLGGMFATGEIVTAEAPDALAVPREAIREEGGNHVLVLEDGVLARRDVTVGEEWGGGLVQVEGVEAGEQVITAALPGLEPGEAVELVEF
jgi:RND family efflux transporter MFP subunit